MKTGIYARVSTKDKGQDTENQFVQLRAFAIAQGWEIVEEYEDQASGSGKQKRPAFDRMMADAVDRRIDMVLFWSLDRLSREGVGKTVGYLDKLTAAGVCWRSFTEQYLDSCGIFKDAVLAILAVVAKQERIRISERTLAGLATARAKGRVGGRKPIAKDEDKIRELRAAGLSLNEVAEQTGVSRATVARVCA
jgi:DNA invertase Pin-like site-specific DNA recombinase